MIVNLAAFLLFANSAVLAAPTSLVEIRLAAQAGDATSQYRLGFMYATGEGVAQDDAEAVRWYRQAADQGLADAQYLLGFSYASGRGVARDDAEAARLRERPRPARPATAPATACRRKS